MSVSSNNPRGTTLLLLKNASSDPDFTDICWPVSGPERSLHGLFSKQPIETFLAGETVFFEDDPAKHIFEISEGVIRLCKALVDGQRVICCFLFEGDFVGISQRDRFLYSAEAVNTVKVRRITCRALEEGMERTPNLRPEIFSLVCDEMQASQKQMILLSCSNALEKVCSFIIELTERQSRRGENAALVHLPMTRLDMADHLGMTIETVSRNLSKLVQVGVLVDVERSTLRIAKPRLLKQLSGGYRKKMTTAIWRQMASAQH